MPAHRLMEHARFLRTIEAVFETLRMEWPNSTSSLLNFPPFLFLNSTRLKRTSFRLIRSIVGTIR